MPSNREAIIADVRRLSGVGAGVGPDDNHIYDAVTGFAEAFDFWYVRVIREAVPKYRSLIIARVNPFIRRLELDGLTSVEVASKLVEDWNSRNFVTAGGWALEELVVHINPEFQKSTAAGIDVQRFDQATGDYHLYVLKSGLVTRNADILSALKRNAREAEARLRQGRRTANVHANYVIAAGKTTTSFKDGVRRPSSAEFWAEALKLPEEQAIDLALAIAAEAGKLVRRDAADHIGALKVLVQDYISDRSNADLVDWEFIARRNMRSTAAWRPEDRERNLRALALLASTGYGGAATVAAEAQADDQAAVEGSVDRDTLGEPEPKGPETA